MVKVILDTNQWIYLANGIDPFSGNSQEGHHYILFKELLNCVENNIVEVLVNDIIIDEWTRNKDNCFLLVQKLEKRMADEKKRFAGLKNELGGEVESEIDKVIDTLEKHLIEKIEKNKSHIENVEKLMGRAVKYEITKETMAFVNGWAIAKKAPFIGNKKNSNADATILFSGIDYLKANFNGFFYDSSIFVSANKNDFCDSKDYSKIHTDLAPSMDEVGMLFYKNLAEALNSIKPKESNSRIFTEEEIFEFEMEFQQMYDSCTCLSCDFGEDRSIAYVNHVIFNHPIEITNEDPYFDPDQIEIPFNENYDFFKITHQIQLGYCNRCDASHLKCSCGSILLTEYSENGEILECNGCDIQYKIYYEHDGNGIVEETFIIAPNSA